MSLHSFSATNLPVRGIDDLRKLSYQEMNSAELDKLRGEDPEAFKLMVDTLDGVVKTEEVTPAMPVPSAKRIIYRNGQPVEISAPSQFVNGMAVE